MNEIEESHRQSTAAIREYIRARQELIAIAERYPHLLDGNDNMIGRIGEYLAIRYLQDSGRKVEKARLRTQKGFDLTDGRGNRISVKILTNENKRGRGVRQCDPWDELMLIVFDTHSLAYRVGHLSREAFDRARTETPQLSARPIIKTSMLGPKGLIGRHGSVSDRMTLAT